MGGSATRAGLAPYPAAYSCCSVFFGGMEGWIHSRLARLDELPFDKEERLWGPSRILIWCSILHAKVNIDRLD